ncbi:MAG: histidine kinase dimerization/phosphoacceptor domain -containing protein [Synechocystis sp.]|jgi:PAS domain S-box-containing protein
MSNEAPKFHILTINSDDLSYNIILEEKRYSIGRNSDNLIPIRDLAISRYHCALVPIKYKSKDGTTDVYQLTFWILDGDLEGNRSSNGLYVNGSRCFSHELKSGDLITFAGTKTCISYAITSRLLEFSAKEVSKQNLSSQTTETTIIPKDSIFTDFLEDIFYLLSHHSEVKDSILNYPYWLLETNLEGEILVFSGDFKVQFPLLIKASTNHPFTKYLVEDLMAVDLRVCIRKVRYRKKSYTQYSRLDKNKQTIKSYIFDSAVSNGLDSIRQGEEKYRAIVRQVSQGIFLVNPQTLKILEANYAYCNLVGYSLKEVTQLTLNELTVLDYHVLKSLIDTVFHGRREICHETVHRHQNGSLIDVEEDISLISYSAHNVICFAVRDIRIRKQTERELQNSLTEKEILLKEIHHRVKNNLLVVSSLIDWQSEFVKDPSLTQIFEESQRRIATIALIHEKLYGSKDLAQINFGDYLKTLADQIFCTFFTNELGCQKIQIQYNVEPIFLNIETAMPCGLIVNELLLNVFKHAFPDQRPGYVSLTLTEDRADHYSLIIQDNGIGFSLDFNPETTQTLGWQLIHLLTMQLDGKVTIKQTEVTTVELIFSKQKYHKRI